MTHQLPLQSPRRVASDARGRKTRSTSRRSATISERFSKAAANEQRALFRLPWEAKAVVTFALFAAALSISRMNPVVQSYNLYFSYSLVGEPSRALRFRWRPIFQASDHPNSLHHPRVVFLSEAAWNGSHPIFDPDEARIGGVNDDMDPVTELRKWPRHEFDPHCQPSAAWQNANFPVCNDIHAGADLRQALIDEEFSILSGNGFWRHAWRHRIGGVNAAATDASLGTVWKTFK